ncbi:MAG: gliding motility lipoprotein GldH [Marinifilaceae bacterium]|jgi:gliding motility-associated lipoprotein GldH|nr:gliding motility lipoprotein GldH [Marinifilaceae bacterium]
MKNIIVGLFIMMAVSCQNTNFIYSEYHDIPDYKWNKDSAVDFQFHLTNNMSAYNLYLNTRNIGQYPFSNLWMYIEMSYPNGEIEIDTVEQVLADERGKWLGDGYGSIMLNKYLLKKNINFADTGQYKIKLVHGMREDNIEGIVNVGVELEQLQAK